MPAIKRHESMGLNPVPDERIEPHDCRSAMGDPGSCVNSKQSVASS